MKTRTFLLAVLAVLLLSAPDTARAQGDIDTFSSKVAPNVVILLGSSPSTFHHMWDDDFDDEKQYPGVCGWAAAPLKPNSSCPGKGNPSDLCPNNEYIDPIGGTPHVNATNTSFTCDPGSGPVTRSVYGETGGQNFQAYSLNYLNWLYGVASSSELTNEPTYSRIMLARKTILAAIAVTNSSSERVRFGVASYQADNGAFIKQPINASTGQSIESSVLSIQPSTAAPISEALVDVGRYFAHKDENLGSYAGINTGPDMIADGPCRMNFVIILSDGHSSQDLNNHYGSAFMDTIGNFDRDANECDPDVAPGHDLTCADSTVSASFSPMLGRDDGELYTNNGSDWLDDVARYLYVTDVRPTTIPGQQNVITYTIGFVNDHPMLREAALNSTGKHFVAGPGSADALMTALLEAINDIIERATSFTSVAVPTARTPFGDALYTGFFLPSKTKAFWQGHLEAYRLRNDGVLEDVNGNPATDSTGSFPEPRQPYWDAGVVLANSNATRNVLTTVAGAQTPFLVSNSAVTTSSLGLLDANEIANYPNYPASGVAALSDLRDAMINYVHGKDAFDEDLDSDSSELREWVLGDIFHSTPLVVAGAPAALNTEAGYGFSGTGTPFYEQYRFRDRVVFAGANDGQLHAFEAGQYHTGDDVTTTGITEDGYWDVGTGAELFSYVPGGILPKLKTIPLNQPRTHFYVDGSPVAADAWFPDPNDPNDFSKEPIEWTTVLITGMRQGDDSYLALDVTNPDAVSSSDPHFPYPNLLWEFTDTDLGESWSRPVITRLKLTGSTGIGDQCGKNDGDGDCREQWVAIFGGGYDKKGDPNLTTWVDDPTDAAWTDKSKALFIVNLHDGQVLASVRFDASGISGPSEMKYSIPSDPLVLDLDFDGFADVVYIGDLGGQIWKWDVSAKGVDGDFNGTMDNWASGVFFESDPVSMGAGVEHYRSFFKPGSAAYDDGDLLLVFGSGERSNLEYLGVSAKDDNNRIFVIEDSHPIGGSAFPGELEESDLTDITGLDKDTDSTDKGFYFVLPESQKSITSHLIFGGQIITAAYTPDPGTSANPCDTAGGSSQLYVFDLASGLGYYTDSVTTGDAARRVTIGPGAASDPRITLSANGDDLYIQTSVGAVVNLDPPPPNFDPVEIVYWKQNF
jgi:type IV pilus assembly protein PilY1